MRFSSIVSLVLVSAICASPLWAEDYKADPGFNPVFSANDRVEEVVVLSDGKLVIGGAVCGNTGTSSCTPMLRRLNTDGSIDATFNEIIGPIASETSFVSGVKRLANGQYFVSGKFTVAGQRTNYVRLNSDGSLDATMATAALDFFYGTTIIEPTTDGKFIACTERSINNELFKIAHRINSDGTPDPTFRVTFMEGFCRDIETLPSGKVLISVGTNFGQTEFKQLQRLNFDGSRDLSFDADIQVGSYISRLSGLTAIADEKVLITFWSSGQSDPTVRRLMPNGSTETTLPLCAGDIFRPQANGVLITNECKHWFGTSSRLAFARVFPDGRVDQSLDAIYLNGRLYGIREAAIGAYYAYGAFLSTQFDTSRRHLVRLIADSAPPKAKFDFDGDGRSDLAIFRPSDRTWYINQSSGGFIFNQWGLSSDVLAAGHFDNDGKTDIGVFRDGTMHAYSSLFAHRQIFMGQAGDKPFLGNFEDYGPNVGDFIVRGVLSGAVRWLFRDGSGVANPVGSSYSFTLPGELATDKPVIGDFNADSREEVGYFRDGQWYTRDYASFQAPQTVQWGSAGDIPVSGDYDGDRQTDYAIFRPSTGDWWVRGSTAGIVVIRFGQNGDIPVPADYDGDGKTDIAIFRNGVWWQYRTGSGTVYAEQWGSAGDKPIPAQHQ